MLPGDSGNTEKSNYQSLGLEKSLGLKNQYFRCPGEFMEFERTTIILAFAVFPHIRLYLTVSQKTVQNKFLPGKSYFCP